MDDPTERWLPIAGWEYYEVSDLGRVRRLAHEITDWIPCGRRVRHLRKLILSPALDGHGYQIVSLSRDRVETKHRVHRLVLEAFAGPCPEGMECLHGPGGRLDNSVANLSWGTRARNLGPDKRRDGTDNRGERYGGAKLTWEAVHDIRRRAAAGETQRSIARHYGVTFQNINLVIARKTWSSGE